MSKKIEEMRQLIGYYNVDPNKAHEYTVNGSQDLYNRTYVNSNEVSETNEANTHNFIDPTKEEAPQDFTSKLSDFFGFSNNNTNDTDNNTNNSDTVSLGEFGAELALGALKEPISEGIDYIKSTNIWKTYTFSKKDILDEANNIHAVTGIPVNAIIDSPENLKNAREVMDRVKKQENLRDQDGNYDLGAMIERYPALKNIANKDEAQAAQILYDLKDVKEPQNIVESIQYYKNLVANGLEIGKANFELGVQGFNGFLGREETEADRARRAAIVTEMQRIEEDMPELSDSLGGAIVGQTAQQGFRYLPAWLLGKGLGAVASGGALAVNAVAKKPIINPKGAFAVGNTVGSVIPMGVEIIGNDYEQYKSLRDKDGKQLLTDNEAKVYSFIDGAIETGIEFWNYQNIMSAIGGKDKEVIKGIVKANEGNKEGIMLSLRGKVLNTLKAGIKSGKGELVEEATQQIDNDFWHNVVMWTHDNAEDKAYTLAEMKNNSIQAAVQAAPSVLGMGLIGGGLNSVKVVRNIAAMENMKRNLGESTIKTITGVQILKDLKAQQAENNIFKKNKEQYQETIKGAVQNSEYKDTTIDTELAIKDPETAQVLYQVAEEAGISREEIDSAIENRAEITVPTEVIASMSLPESANNKLMDIVSFEKGGNSLGRIKYEATRLKELNDTIVKKAQEQQRTMADNIAESLFPSKPGQDNTINEAYRVIASMIINNNPKNPAEGWKAELNNAQAEIDNRLQPIIDLLKEDYGNGVSLISLDEQHGNAGTRGEKLKISNNAGWYSQWYKKNKRQPTKNDLEDIAIEIYKGSGKRYGGKYGKWDLDTAQEMASNLGSAQDFEALEAERNAKVTEIDNLFERREMLRDMKDQMLQVNASEMTLTKGLSPEGLQVYNTVKGELSQATGKGVKSAAKMSAVLFAQHADIVAKALTEAGTPMTALDYMDNMVGLNVSATLENTDNKAAAQYNQVAQAKEIEEVRKKYEGTDKWLKAPNGEATNLTEEQWLTVRTKAFKNWFGNWEGKRAKHSQVLDKNGEPIVVYHGSYESFDTFDSTKSRANMDIQGNFFSPEKRDAQDYGNNVRAFYLNIRNPASQQVGYKALEKFEGQNEAGIKARELLIEMGYDGVNNDGDEYIAFNPTQIKAVDNKGTFNPNDGNVYHQAAYHGSPHIFEKFDLGAIGTGEGAQAHGWGLYFAKDKETAESYKKLLSIASVSYNGEVIDERKDTELAKIAIIIKSNLRNTANKTVEGAIDFIRSELKRDKDVLAMYEEEKRNGTNNPDIDLYIKTAKFGVEAKENKLALYNKYVAKGGVFELGKQSSLFEVDVPENDVLLDEQKTFDEQPEVVQEAIKSIFDGLDNPYYTDVFDEDTKGEEIYYLISDTMGGDREASEALNELGVKGITYVGDRDGRCFVVFDDQAIDVINRYNQAANNKSIQGQIAISQKGKSIISLFATANESTFIHEMGHLALRDLKLVAELENAPAQFVKDWNTIKDFIGWKEDQTDFTVEQQEKFARSFEGYLRKGDAPTRGLQRVFRNFKKWLTNIYTNLKQLGGDISPEVKAVMDRMIATQEQIEEEASLQEIDNFNKVFKSGKVDNNTESMHARWIAEAKEVVGEKVLAKAMENVKENWNTERANIIKEEKAAIEQDYANNKIQLAAEAVKLNGGNYELVANALGFNSVEELKQAITDLETEKEVAFNSFVEALDTSYNADNLKTEAEEMLMTTEYRNMAVGLELEYLSKKATQVNNLDKKIATQLDSLEKALQEADKAEPNSTNPADGKAYVDQPGGKYSALRKQIANLKYAARWNEAENKLLFDIQKAKGKAEALRAVQELKSTMANRTEQLKVLRDEAVGTVAQYKAYAQRKIAEMSIAQATGIRAFIQQERRKAKEVEKLALQGKWQEALATKREQLLFSNLAEQSIKVKENINKQVSRVQKRVLRLGKADTKFPIENRYMYQHIAYVFGFAKSDIELPEGVTVSLADLLRKWNNDNSLVVADTEEAGNIGLPTWFTNAVAGKTVYEGKYKTTGYEGLTIDDFNGVIETLNNVYTLGINENKLLTIKDNDGNSLDLDTAVNSLVDSVNNNVAPLADYDPTGLGPAGYFEKLSSKAKAGKDFFTNIDKALSGANKFGLALIKAETIFDRLDGGKHGFFMKYFYDVINEARTKEVTQSVEYGKRLANIFESNYSQKERTDMYYNRDYSFSGQKITKQQLMCIALNCGTELNKKRVLDGFGVTENELNELLSNLQERDWNTIQAIWNTFNDLWPETVKVELSMNGSNLQKEKAVPFTVTSKEGTTFNIEGGYYPIKYNSQVSVTAQTQEADNLAKGQMSGNAIFGVGRGFTKARTKQTVARPILTDFSVISSTLNDVIHNICFRKACRDTNRLITNKTLQEALLKTIGKNSYNVLNSWVKDNWSRENKNGQVDNVIRYARTHLTMSVLGFRTTTAVLNVINFSPMCEYLGGLNALKAVTEFYSSPLANKDFVLNKSVFLQNRSELMDRDFGEVIRNLRKKDTTLSKIQAQSFSIIAATDLMFAMPLFKFEYERVYQEELTKGIPAEKIEQHAVAAGDQAVRRVFGSGDTKDLAGMQKGSELDKALTMYYSYFNVVLNSIARKYYKGKDTGNWTGLARSLIYWLVIPAAAESILRAAMGGEEDWTPEAILKRAVRNFGDQITGTIPVIRDVAKWPLDMIIDGKSFGSKEVSFGALGIVRRANDTIQLVLQMQGANKNKKDWLDVAQSAVKTSNAVTGFSDTFTDSLFTTGRWISNDFENDVSDYIYSLVMDKKLETKGALPKKKKK